MTKALRAGIFLFVCLLLCVAAALLTFGALAGGGVGATLATGRSIRVTSSAWSLHMRTTRDSATIDTGGHRIVVAPAFVRVDRDPPVPIDASVKSIVVHTTKESIAISADGRTNTIWTR
jgi:hypothetical protein